MPAATASSASRKAEKGVSSDGFSTTALPAASAGAHFHDPITSGKFQGAIAPTTPIGSAMTNLYAQNFRFPVLQYSADWIIVLMSFVISFGAAALGAVSAVRKAVGLPPADAMRPEPPARFTAGFLEKIGLQKYLSANHRIVLRNLSRQPVKAALSIIGISLAAALLFTGFYFFDAINKIISVAILFMEGSRLWVRNLLTSANYG